MNEKDECNRCKVTKMMTEFNKNKRTKNGYNSICKDCKKNSDKLYRELNKEKIKTYRKNNKDYFKKKNKEYREVNSEYFKKKNKEHYQKNKGTEKYHISHIHQKARSRSLKTKIRIYSYYKRYNYS